MQGNFQRQYMLLYMFLICVYLHVCVSRVYTCMYVYHVCAWYLRK